MSIDTQDNRLKYDPRTVFNVPNQLTSIRLVLAIVLFVLIAYEQYLAGMWVFLIAAGTDWIDGYWARKYNQVTTLGRILDPFVDKIIICGTFIFLASLGEKGSGMMPWMAVVVVGRELMVTALRSFLEQQGADFSATLSGKLKMVLQCAAAAVSLYRLSYGTGPEVVVPAWLQWSLVISVWSAVALTVISGIAYVFAAVKLLRHQVGVCAMPTDEQPLLLKISVNLVVAGSLGVWWLIVRRLTRHEPAVRFEPRRPAPWQAADLAVIFLALIGISAIAGQALNAIRHGPAPETLGTTELAANVAVEILLVAFAIGYLMLRTGATPRDLGFDVSGFGGRDLLIGATAYLAAMLPVGVIQDALEHLQTYEHPLIKAYRKQPDTTMLVIAAVSAVVVAPLVEEFFFRVLLQGWLESIEARRTKSKFAAIEPPPAPRTDDASAATAADEQAQGLQPLDLPTTDHTNPYQAPQTVAIAIPAAAEPPLRQPTVWWPILVSSELFAVMHWGYGLSPIPLFFLGLVLGYVYQRTHRIWPSLVVHLLVNSGAIVVLWYEIAKHP